MACDRFDVSPVDTPTQQAIIRISYGSDSPPTAAMAASPSVAAKAMSTKVNSDRIPNDSTRGAAILRIEGPGWDRAGGRPGPAGCCVIEARHSSRATGVPGKRREGGRGIRME